MYLDFHRANPAHAAMLKGHPRSLTLLDFGQFLVNEPSRMIRIMGALVKTDAEETILIDTGFPAKYARDRAAAAEEDGLGSFGALVAHGPENTIAGQLELLGEDKIDLLLMTHTHIDHVGGLAEFPGVPIVIGAGERALEKPLYFNDAQPMDWPDAEYRVIDQDVSIGPGFDLYYVPGHSPGLFCARIALPGAGRLLYLGDAISRESEPGEGFPGAWNLELAAHHARRLMALDYDFMIYGHDPDQGLRLPFGRAVT
ncbi:MAG: MBL fold metallo-hydrolase [Pseudomonadota bacterium]